MRDNAESAWLKERLNGIGASDAAAILGLSPYMNNERLWGIKTCRVEPSDISGSPFIQYGKAAEKHLRELFALDFPQYEVGYEEYKIIRNPDYPFIFATLDGALMETDTGRKGILEIKTTEILQAGQWEKWKDCIPDNYYIQVLHQLLATGWDFAVLKAQIKWRKKGELNLTTRHYNIERSLVADDLDYLLEPVLIGGNVGAASNFRCRARQKCGIRLPPMANFWGSAARKSPSIRRFLTYENRFLKEETEFWNCVTQNRRPNTKLPPI